MRLHPGLYGVIVLATLTAASVAPRAEPPVGPELTPKLLNPNGVTHGAVLYAMADTGMGGALLTTLDGGRYCTTVEIKISYFRALRSRRLSCESWVVHRGKRIAFLEAAVSDDDGLVAQASGTFAILEPRGAA